MKKLLLVLGVLVLNYVFFAMGIVTAEVKSQVNIAEVEGKYKEVTFQDLVDNAKTRSIQFSLIALEASYNAGYHQALIDYKIMVGTDTLKDEEKKK